MNAEIHPKYYPNTKVTCACGNTFTTGSTKPEIQVEICAACHPFFTGEMKLIDTQGRIERFQEKQRKAAAVAKSRKKKIKVRKQRERPGSLKEMLTIEIRKSEKQTSSTKKQTSTQ
ncbi:50S ribosomal protein L31 [Patescibacteria group bacterium]|nr:50S ribosomal protein L31 [Patescibacteria group bacterium]